MVVFDLYIHLHDWQVWLTLIISVNAVAGILFSAARFSVRYVRKYVLEAANALDARRHEELVALRADILRAMDRTTPGVGIFEDIEESELGGADVTGYRST